MSQAPPYNSPFLDLIKKASNAQLIAAVVLLSEAIAALLDGGFSLLLYGEIRARIMLIGFVTCFFASLAAGSGITFLLSTLRRVEVQALKAIIEARQTSSAIMEASPLSIYITDTEGKVLTASPAHERFFEGRGAVGNFIWDLLPEEKQKSAIQRYFETLRAGGQEDGTLAPGSGLDLRGQNMDVRLALSRIKGPEGETLGYCAALEDRTERRVMSEQLSASAAEREALSREVHRRVKGNMALVSSLLSLQAGATATGEAREILAMAKGRIRAMALAYDTLYRCGNLSDLSLRSYMDGLVASVKATCPSPPDKTILWNMDVDNIVADIDTLMPCGMALNELMTNSLQHAFSQQAWGQISLVLRKTPEGGINILYHDNGSGLPEGLDWRASSGLGLKLVSGFVAQLGGTLDLAPVREGLGFNIMIPASR